MSETDVAPVPAVVVEPAAESLPAVNGLPVDAPVVSDAPVTSADVTVPDLPHVDYSDDLKHSKHDADSFASADFPPPASTRVVKLEVE